MIQKSYKPLDPIDSSDKLLQVDQGAAIRFFYPLDSGNLNNKDLAFGGFFTQEDTIPPNSDVNTGVKMLSLTSSVISEISISDKACDFDSVGKALENSAQSEVKLNNHFRMMQKLKTAKQKVSYCLQQVSLVAGKSTANGGYSIHFGKAEMKAMTGLSQRTIGSTLKELVKDKSITFLYPGSYWISKDIVNKKILKPCN